MGYLHIDNLYKNQTILLFKECYALEKIHGTSAHISWDVDKKKVTFFSGGESYETFVLLFDIDFLHQAFADNFMENNVVIFGEAYGGKQQAMSKTYGKQLKFIGFDVKVGERWLNVLNAESVCQKLNIEFVDYVKVSTDLETLNTERDKQSVQAIRNGCGEGKMREGIILKPLIELRTNNGERVVAKYKRDEFKETKTRRDVNPIQLKILDDAKAIAEEWVTEMRLQHVLDKLPKGINIENTKLVIEAMVEDIYREAKGEIIENKEVTKFIGSKTAVMFKKKLQNDMEKANL
jgi:hypothetical protein